MMKHSKTRKKMIKVKPDLSLSRPNSPKSVAEDAGRRTLDWLISVFPHLSLEQIDLAYKDSGGDTFKAAGILGAELVDPGECPESARKEKRSRKHKRIAASSGMVSGIIGKDYSKSVATWSSPVEVKKRAVCAYNIEEAEEFLCSISELGMSVVRDILSQCGYDLEKALDSLLDMSKLSNNQFKERIGVDHIEVVSGEHRKGGVKNSKIHREMLSQNPSRNEPSSFQLTDKPSVRSAKEQGILQFVGSDCREYLNVPLNTKEHVSSKSGMLNSDLQHKVLESLFNVSKMPCEVNSMSWKKVIEQVKSFGQGLEFSFEGPAEPSSESRVSNQDDYHFFRSVAKTNWDTMKSYYHKATLSYSRGERAQASYLSEKGKLYKKFAHEADEKASQKIFEARNNGIKNVVTIDLHGQHVKQAIRLLKLHLLLFAYIPSVHFLRVITGCGADGVGLGKLKRTVLDLVQKEGIKCNQENSGTLLLCIGGKRSFTFMESESDSDNNIP